MKNFSTIQDDGRRRPFGLCLHLVISLLISAGIMVICFPQMYLKLDYSLIRFQDTEFLAFGMFTFVQNLAHGRVQLWNSYDQMPLAYFYLTGMMTYAHAMGAMFFVLTQSLAEDTGRYLYDVSTIVFNLIPTIFRTAGLYLLVRLFSNKTSTILLSTALGSSIFNPQFHLGLNCTAIYSLMPLAVFFVLRFVVHLRIRDFIFALLIVTIAIAFNPLVGLGYFYQGMHFFLLAVIGWIFFKLSSDFYIDSQQKRITLTFKTALTFDWKAIRIKCNARVYLLLGAASLLAVLIMLPWVILLITTYPDYDLAHSTSRFANGFTIFGYFDRPHYGATPWLFFTKQLDFSNNEWISQWVFVGWTCIFFTICGAVLSRDSRKYIFIITVIFFWLIQFSRDPASVFSTAHWLNALTNPFNSVLRSAHMTGAFLLPTMMIPLFAMGVDRVKACVFGSPEGPDKKRIIAVLFILLFIIFAALYPMKVLGMYPGRSAILYIIISGCIGGLILGASIFRDEIPMVLRFGAAIGFSIMLLADVWAARKYFAQMANQMQVMTHEIDGIQKTINPVGLDYQNALLNPVREHYANVHIGQVKPFFLTDPNNMQGIFYRYTNMEKYFEPATNYKPRHRSYTALAIDHSLQEYIRRDSRISYIADAAVRYDKNVVQSLLNLNLDRRVVAIEDDSIPKMENSDADFRNIARSVPIPVEQKLVKAFRLGDARRLSDAADGVRHYSIALPLDFPRALVSGVFTADRDSVQFHVGTYELKPAQGWLVRPMQFDLQNIHAGTLQFLIPSAMLIDDDTQLELRYQAASPLNGISTLVNEPDRVGFEFRSERAGWLVLHYPYDPKWRVTLNGAVQRSYRANGAFIGVPIPAGKSSVLLEYSPDSWLRFLIPLSLFLSISVLLAAIVWGSRSQSLYPDSIHGLNS